ncbi:MAG: DUF4197 domain-containing protein, partial [Gammaproteobacteria bacterium]|nr:DUF4197 domain-containing protein [Gammaproteobacteria bacterium]
MTNYKFLSALTFIILSLAVNQVNAENWWDKGKDFLKSLEDNKQSTGSSINPSISEINKAFKEALRIGSENVVSQLSAIDGFNKDPAIHIPLPKNLKSVKKVLEKFGMRKEAKDLELKLNRAAEAATPKAKELFLQSINEMTFNDVKSIYEGPEDSATQYFKKKMSPSLSKEMRSIIESSLSEVGAIKAYNKVMGKYKKLPFVPDVKADLTKHVIKKGMSGIFYYLAKEEAAIRKDPVKQTT